MTMRTSISDRWFTGGNGNRFFDWGGFRYCVSYLGPHQFEALRNGESPGRAWENFETQAEAQRFVEQQSGYR